MSILVTGGAGYIGSHTVLELLQAGYEVVVIDNLCNSKEASLERVRELANKSFKFYPIDLINKEEVEKVFEENDIEAVIHFAGLKAVGESVKMPMKYYYNNLVSTMVLCEVMKAYKVTKLVFSSSATVYGKPKEVPIAEDSPLHTTNPYGRTKLMIEDILRDLCVADSSWSILLLRYFNPIGAHESGQIGEDPNGIPNNLVPYITQVAVGKQKQLKVFGDDYDTLDGTGVRDYIHVVDLAKGHVKSLERLMRMKGVETYNLGTGKGYSVLQVVQAFEKVTGKKIPYEIQARREGDIATCFADPTKAYEVLEWQAEYNLEKMCEDAWKWQSNNPDGYVS